MKRIFSFILATIVLFSMTATPSRAFAQTANIQKALESAKETLDNLVTAKDDKQATELPLRIKTLEQAIALSIEEAKDVRTKLNDLDNLSDDEKVWRAEKTGEIKMAIEHFDAQKKDVEERSDTLTEQNVKTIAGNFKTWRADNYLPTLNEARDYLFITQQTETIQTAKKRWQKIDEDVKKLEKAKVKNIASARKLLKNADGLIVESETMNTEARDLFFNTFITTTTATSSDATSTTEKQEKDTTPPPSIRDLVKDSSTKIRDAYKIFIEMSSLVRKLLK